MKNCYFEYEIWMRIGSLLLLLVLIVTNLNVNPYRYESVSLQHVNLLVFIQIISYF